MAATKRAAIKRPARAKMFRLEIELGNDGMLTPGHVAGALRKVADKLKTDRSWDGSIMDINGNTVGKYETETWV